MGVLKYLLMIFLTFGFVACGSSLSSEEKAKAEAELVTINEDMVKLTTSLITATAEQRVDLGKKMEELSKKADELRKKLKK